LDGSDLKIFYKILLSKNKKTILAFKNPMKGVAAPFPFIDNMPTKGKEVVESQEPHFYPAKEGSGPLPYIGKICPYKEGGPLKLVGH